MTLRSPRKYGETHAELHEPGGSGSGVGSGDARHLHGPPVAVAGLGRELGEREGPDLEPGRLTGRHEAGVGRPAEADPVEGLSI